MGYRNRNTGTYTGTYTVRDACGLTGRPGQAQILDTRTQERIINSPSGLTAGQFRAPALKGK